MTARFGGGPEKKARGGPILAVLSQGSGVCAIHAVGVRTPRVSPVTSLIRAFPVCPRK